MALKSKLVTLEDLKEVVKRMTIWEEITNSLTWTNTNHAVSGNTVPGYLGPDFAPKQAISAKKTTITLAKGDQLRVTGCAYYRNNNITGTVLMRESAVVIDPSAGGQRGGLDQVMQNDSDASGLVYGMFVFRAAYAGTFELYDWSNAGKIIVEKAKTA